MNLEAIKKAAGALEAAYKRAEAVNFDPCAEETLNYHFEREDFVDEVERLGASELIRLAEIGEMMQWIPVSERLPECDMTPNSFGTQVLIWPPHEQSGHSSMPIAFYGCRHSDKPSFYIYGRLIDVTHWMPLPEAP